MDSSSTKTWEQAVEDLSRIDPSGELVRACYFDRPLCTALNRYLQSDEWAEWVKLIPQPPGRALEIGAGFGLVSFGLASAGWSVIAAEPDPSSRVGAGAIQTFREEVGLAVPVVRAVGERLPFADGSFDLVVARQVLHHASDLDQLASECSRVLRPAGVFVAGREHVLSRPDDLSAFLGKHPLHRLYGGENAFVLDRYLSAFGNAHLFVSRTIGPWESAINMAPHTEAELASRILSRVLPPTMIAMMTRALVRSRAVSLALKVLNRCDSTPGRLYSFVCTKT